MDKLTASRLVEDDDRWRQQEVESKLTWSPTSISTPRKQSSSIATMGSGMWSSLVIAALVVVGCSKAKPAEEARVLTDKPITQCVVDDNYVYGFADEIVRISRSTGAVEHISSDFRNFASLATVKGRIYWRDSDGVHEWREGTTTRKTLAKASVFQNREIESLTAFGDRICWSVDELLDERGRSRVDCLDVTNDTIENWAEFNGSPLITRNVMAFNDHLFSAESETNRCTVYDITTKSPVEVGRKYEICGEAFVTPEGPSIFQFINHYQSDGGAPPIDLWLATQNREVSVPSSVGLVRSLAGTTYLYADTLFTLNLKSGEKVPVQLPAEPRCGDRRALFGLKDHKFIEFPPPMYQ